MRSMAGPSLQITKHVATLFIIIIIIIAAIIIAITIIEMSDSDGPLGAH